MHTIKLKKSYGPSRNDKNWKNPSSSLPPFLLILSLLIPHLQSTMPFAAASRRVWIHRHFFACLLFSSSGCGWDGFNFLSFLCKSRQIESPLLSVFSTTGENLPALSSSTSHVAPIQTCRNFRQIWMLEPALFLSNIQQISTTSLLLLYSSVLLPQ